MGACFGCSRLVLLILGWFLVFLVGFFCHLQRPFWWVGGCVSCQPTHRKKQPTHRKQKNGSEVASSMPPQNHQGTTSVTFRDHFGGLVGVFPANPPTEKNNPPTENKKMVLRWHRQCHLRTTKEPLLSPSETILVGWWVCFLPTHPPKKTTHP